METKYKFMQIYGNCTCVHILGNDRPKGPVDNVITKGVPLLKELIEGDYFNYIKKNTPIITSRIPSNPKDHAFQYDYDIVSILHNDPRTEKSLINLQQRVYNFKEYLKKVKTDPTYFFIYSMNDFDISKESHKLNIIHFEANIKYLKEQQLLDKIIFVETRNFETPKSFWNYWCDNYTGIVKKYNLKYIQVTGLVGGGLVDNYKTAGPQFYKKAEKAIEMWRLQNEKSSNN